MSRRVHWERSLHDTAPLRGGMGFVGSNRTVLSRATGKIPFDCPICGIGFEKYACWVRRGQKNVYCGRGCANEAKKVRIETHCVTCGKAMEQTPSDAERRRTCSYRCACIKKRSDNPQPKASVAYKKAVAVIAARSECSCCGRTYGPWVVRGMVAAIGDDGIARADGARAKLWCRDCHLRDLAPFAVQHRTYRPIHNPYRRYEP